MIKCPRCGAEDFLVIPNTQGEIKRRGCLMTCLHILLTIVTGGLWLVVPLLRGSTHGKISTQPLALCKLCGTKWRLK